MSCACCLAAAPTETDATLAHDCSSRRRDGRLQADLNQPIAECGADVTGSPEGVAAKRPGRRPDLDSRPSRSYPDRDRATDRVRAALHGIPQHIILVDPSPIVRP